jgi:hypothetical protein
MAFNQLTDADDETSKPTSGALTPSIQAHKPRVLIWAKASLSTTLKYTTSSTEWRLAPRIRHAPQAP